MTFPVIYFGLPIYVMACICSFLRLDVFVVLIFTFSVFCKDLQPVGLYRRSLSKLDSKLPSNSVIAFRSGGEINTGK